MMVKDIKNYLKSSVPCPNWYVGRIDGKKEQCIGVYTARTQPKPVPIAIGGVENTTYNKLGVEILVHWGEAPTDAEEKAQSVYKALYGQNPVIGGKRVIKIDLNTSCPVYAGVDENGIYEFVVGAVIYYER
ncbi:MAG: minor capsid protein [Anaerovoracaceae bacterium]